MITKGMLVKVVPAMNDWHPLAYQVGTVVEAHGPDHSKVLFGQSSIRIVENNRLFSVK